MSETRVVARRAGLVALGTLASRVLGMARESVVAAIFPVAVTDVFWIAYTIPNTLRMLLGEGAVANAFVPVFADVQNKRGEAESRQFLARFGGTLLLLLSLACIVGMLGARLFGWAYAGGFASEPQRFELLVWLIRWLFPFLLLAGLAALATGVLNVLGRFTLPAFAPALFNVGMIAAPFTLLHVCSELGLPPIASLAFGALAGGLLALLVLLPSLKGLGMLPMPRLAFGDPDVRRALGLMGPMVLGMGVYQLNMLLSRLFTSFLPVGSQSYLSYGMRVVEIPQGMFALALASAALPALARLRSQGKTAELLKLFQASLKLSLLVALPASIALYALAEPTCAVLLGRGMFRAHDVSETARSLGMQALGVWAVACVRSVVPMFAAHQDTRTPVRASAANLVVFLGLSALLMGPLDHVALAIANSVAAMVQLGLLLFWLRKHTGPLGLKALLASTARIAAASLAMGAVLLLLAAQFDWNQPSRELTRLVWFVGVGSAGVLTFLVSARLFGVSELVDLTRAVRRRMNRAT